MLDFSVDEFACQQAVVETSTFVTASSTDATKRWKRMHGGTGIGIHDGDPDARVRGPGWNRRPCGQCMASVPTIVFRSQGLCNKHGNVE